MEHTTDKPKLPIKDARDIAEARGWDQVIIVARRVGDNGYEHVVTYGRGTAQCRAAARAGNAIKHHLMKWPSALFDSALRIFGVGRDSANRNAVLVYVNREPSDEDLQMIHDMIRPDTFSPEQVERGA